MPTWIDLKVDDALLRLGFRTPIDLSEVDIVDRVTSQVPETSIADRATELCTEIYDPWLLAHCKRTFAFGVLLGDEFDGETLFLAAMLHDVGLTEAYEFGASQVSSQAMRPIRHPASRCGAGQSREASRTSSAWREAPDREALAEAIALHVNVRVKEPQGVEAHLVHLASAQDVTGLRSPPPRTRSDWNRRGCVAAR